ncbi:hypothetical protein [Sorangium sp. So ce204]|uniref:hypothetical protein n=1 Tax=Sorangium sp. So ce204 TaxID=3133288 RepID=UPI003F61A567
MKRFFYPLVLVAIPAALSACGSGHSSESDELAAPDELTGTAEGALACGGLAPGESLDRSQSIRSCNGRVRLVHQTDGNVVAYDETDASWATHTAPRSDTTRFIMQTDGNLVLYAGARALWSSRTAGNPGARFALQDDCNLVIYNTAGRPIWTTSTSCRTSSVVDLFDYMTPGCSASGPQYTTQVTGARWYVPQGKDDSGRRQFVYVKGRNGADYESYTADEQWNPLWKDTSWAYFDTGIQTYCDEQCGALNCPTDCRHQWRGDPVSGGYAYQAPKDTTDWGGAKVLPRYFDKSRGVQTYTFDIYVDAQSETTCGACDSWHEGWTWQRYTVEHLSSVTAPNGQVYTDVIKKVIIDGAGKDEVYYFAKGSGWIGYEVQHSTYKDWINGTTTGVSLPTICPGGGPASSC